MITTWQVRNSPEIYPSGYSMRLILLGITNLSKILIQEEVDSYVEDDNQDELAALHNDAFKTLALVHIVSKVARPLCDDLEERLKATKIRIDELLKLKQQLEET